MKRLLYSLSGLGLVSLLVIGMSGSSSARGDTHRSPVQGAWSWTQFTPATTGFGTPSPIPTALAGTLFMAADNSFTGHAVLNSGLSSPLGPALEFDFDGTVTFRNGDISNGMDVLVNVPAFRVSNSGRFCVAMTQIGGCFQEFRCTNTNEPGTVLLVEFKRQRFGTCK